MSEPWIRVYMGDLRADPKLMDLPIAMRWALLHAWDLAKNGPGDVAELRASDGRAMSERELRRLASVSGNETRAMFERWASVGLCEIVYTVEGPLCTFPNLAKRQGIDRTAAERMRRYRKRRRDAERYGQSDGDVTASRYGPVTGENQSTEEVTSTDSLRSSVSQPSARQRPRDLIWDALVAACGYSPGTATERGAWNKARKELKGGTPEEVAAKAKAFKQRYPNLRCTPTALVRQWGALGEVNGRPPPRSMDEVNRIYEEYVRRERL